MIHENTWIVDMTESEIITLLGGVWVATMIVPKSFQHRNMLLLLLVGLSVVLVIGLGLDYVSRMFNDPGRFWFLS
jgi:hypothetical protein